LEFQGVQIIIMQFSENCCDCINFLAFRFKDDKIYLINNGPSFIGGQFRA
jgi:hypothetical protein